VVYYVAETAWWGEGGGRGGELGTRGDFGFVVVVVVVIIVVVIIDANGSRGGTRAGDFSAGLG
jgi:hypothetical protein